MNYAVPVNFDSIESALSYVKSELQLKVDQNNEMVLKAENNTAQVELLQAQEITLRDNCNELTQKIVVLEGKRETIKTELKEYTQKTTDRLDKERAEFETVRIKRRDELEKIENDLNTRQETLEQLESRLVSREKELDERQLQLEVASQGIISRESEFVKIQQDIDQIKVANEEQLAAEKKELSKRSADLDQREFIVRDSEVGIEKKKKAIAVESSESEEYYKQASELVLVARSRMNKIEAVDKQLKQREERLNLREKTLQDLDKTLTTRKIQLDDRTMTMKSYS